MTARTEYEVLTDLIRLHDDVVRKPHVAFRLKDRHALLRHDVMAAWRMPTDARRYVGNAAGMLLHALDYIVDGGPPRTQLTSYIAAANIAAQIVREDAHAAFLADRTPAR